MISVIIRNRDEAKHIGFAIQSVVDHVENPEIIVIDNKSNDDSMKVVSLFDRYNIKTYLMEEYTPGKALNFGVTKCSFDIVLILSAHSQITKLNLDLVKESLQNNVAVFGSQIPVYRGKKITKRYIWSHFNCEEQTNMFSKTEDRLFLHNAFCFYTREVLENIPFDEKLSGKEDRYWAKEVVDRGLKYFYTPALEANHFWTPNGATWKGIG
jgi:glycosyltransferase involved in cell wall biosynthesis